VRHSQKNARRQSLSLESIPNLGATTRGGDIMIEFRIKMIRLSLLAACCSLGVLIPTNSYADLNGIACGAIHRGCLSGCNTDRCIADCDANYISCLVPATKKQQTPPPPCTGVRCTLPVHNPPTTVSDPAHPPRHPVRPVKPVGVSNSGNTNTGNSSPVILLRKHESGQHGQGH
jgi:hypothetical protein